ncbi:MAG: hypothetical protein AB1586_11980 [Pseudomonadota bacterium]
MRDLMLQAAGVIAILTAVIHGVLGETKVFASATIEPRRLRTLIRLVWQCSTVAWIAGGVLLFVAPLIAAGPARHWIVGAMAAMLAFGALANAFATRGRHPGWMALTVAVGLAVAGY